MNLKCIGQRTSSKTPKKTKKQKADAEIKNFNGKSRQLLESIVSFPKKRDTWKHTVRGERSVAFS